MATGSTVPVTATAAFYVNSAGKTITGQEYELEAEWLREAHDKLVAMLPQLEVFKSAEDGKSPAEVKKLRSNPARREYVEAYRAVLTDYKAREGAHDGFSKFSTMPFKLRMLIVGIRTTREHPTRSSPATLSPPNSRVSLSKVAWPRD